MAVFTTGIDLSIWHMVLVPLVAYCELFSCTLHLISFAGDMIIRAFIVILVTMINALNVNSVAAL